MEIEHSFALILSALSAFFALVSILFTVAVSFFIWYLAKLSGDRKQEIREIIKLQNDFERKLNSFGPNIDVKDIKKLQDDFDLLKQNVYSNIFPYQDQGVY